MEINWYRTGLATLMLTIVFENTSACKDDPVHCAVSSWTGWGTCSKTCELGSQRRTRYVTRNPKHGGRKCPSLAETRGCRELAECPINCQWGEWGEWTNCSSYGTKSRIRNITTPAMFGGDDCTGINTDVDSGCVPSPASTMECANDSLMCQDGLTCVRDTLACNGDDDCTDFSDELHCNEILSPCPTPKDRIPSIDVVGAGFNLVGNEEIGTILDNWRFNGRCSVVTSGDHEGLQFRLPANILSYRFQALAATSVSTKSYDGPKSFFQEEREERQSKLEGGFSFLGISAKAAYSSDTKRRTVVENGSKAKSIYFKIQFRIEVAQFRTLRNNLILSHSFRQRELDLPEHFDYAEYSKIITDFGTHYYSSGVLGGEFESIFRFDSSELTESRLTEEEQRACIENEIFSIKSEKCSTNALSQRYDGSFIGAAKDVVVTVKGGSSDTAASLSFSQQETPSKEDFDAWAATVKDNPAVVDFMLAPISAVFESKVKQAYMDEALYQYLKRFDPEVCPPKCLNGGSPIVTEEGKECNCLCEPNFFGPACRDR